jgi:hypothetical protein
MNSTNSNINKKTCSPISSNCVDWEGGDLPCIGLCKRDSISDVTRKAVEVLCDIKTELDLSDLDLKCILEACSACPAPSKTLKNVLTLLIEKVCTLEELIGSPSSGTTADPELILAACFRYTDSDGDIVTKLAHSEYTKRIGLKVCDILLELSTIQSTLDNHETRITDLEAGSTPPGTPQVNSVCVAPGASVSSPVVKDVDEAFELLESQFCNLKTVLGETTALTQALPTEPQASGTPSGIYSLVNPGQALWVTAASTIAEFLNHIGKAVADLRGAVKLIQDNCCKITCDDITVDFDIRLSDDRLTATLFFITKSQIPVGFSDCNPVGNKLTITDSDGNRHDLYVKIADEANNPSGLVIDLSGTPLDPSLDYTFSMDACMTDGTTNCVKCVTKTATYKDTCAYCEIVTSGVGSTGATSSVTIIYEE